MLLRRSQNRVIGTIRVDRHVDHPQNYECQECQVVDIESCTCEPQSSRKRRKRHWSSLQILACFWAIVGLAAGCIAIYFGIEKQRIPQEPVATSPTQIAAAASVEKVSTQLDANESTRIPAKSNTTRNDHAVVDEVSLADLEMRDATRSRESVDRTVLPLDHWNQSHLNGDDWLQGDAPFEARNIVDHCIMARLDELGIPPARLCSDEVFLRRVFVDVIGTLPTIDEANAFFNDLDPQKRERLIEHLLHRPEFAEYWAMKWCDVLRVKSEFPINLWPHAAQAYHRWVRSAMKNNIPLDEFARELLTSSGSNFRTPQVNFYRALESQKPSAIASAVALTFMGERSDRWTEERLRGMSVFFSRVGYKPTGEWKEEIVFFDRFMTHEGHEETASKLGELSGVNSDELIATLPSGARIRIPSGVDPRNVFADWLLDKRNPWFSRVAVNRIWYWLMGRGVVDPPDDVRRDNPPSHPDLLTGLAYELIDANYDMRHIYRLILNSSTYQLSCIPPDGIDNAEAYYACYGPRRLDAEVLIDAICQITETSETYSSITPEPYTFLPEYSRAISIPDGSITSSFLEMFGRPARDSGMQSERNNHLTARQALHLLNSNHLLNKLKHGPGIQDLLLRSISTTDAAEQLYLKILSRNPTMEELTIAVNAYDSKAEMRDLAWALINSDEFLYRH